MVVNSPPAANGRGLHTLVDGLTLSPSSPVASPILVTAPSASVAQSVFSSSSAAASSIFNNPGASSLASASSRASPSAPSFGNAGTRLHSFGARRLNYPVASSSTTAMRSTAISESSSAVKEVDDPTSTPAATTSIYDRGATQTTLSKLFATPTPPISFGQSGRCNSYRGSDSVKLEDFLYTRGFREGACSDITIVAFGSRYPLHRLILDRSPFFSSCFNGGPWLESKSSEISLSPETSDPNITQYAFELALARLYGHVDRTEEDKNALPLMAAASYLDLQDLAESCVASLLRNLKTSNISLIVRFVTNSYYGHLTDRLLESAKALLYRDGYEMHFSEWDGISGDVAAEIAGYEGFYVPSEFERYKFVRNMINWRIKHSYSYPDSPVDEHFVKLASGLLKTEDDGDSCSVTGDDDADIRPLRELLEEGIYYVHMSFEELQNIAADRDILGRPTVSERTIRDALWQQMVLRQRVLNAPLKEARLGITKKEYVGQKPTFGNKSPARIPTPKPLGGKTSQSSAVPSTPPSNVDYLNPSLLGVSKEERRKYYIPTEDSTTVIGDCPEQPPQVIVSQRGVRGGNSTTSLPTDTSINEASTDGKDTDSSEVGEELCYSDFPPFRFSAEFRSVRTLKEKKRVYSKTVFYAGSYWNIYIQKVKSSKNVQLGVYLHRAKDREGSGSSGGGSRDGNDISLGKIDFDERALSLPEQRGRGGSDNDLSGNEGDSSILTTDAGDTTTSTFASSATARPGANTSASRASVVQAAPAVPAAPVEVGVPAMPHYVDSRPMIQTYFKIFSPSRKGKMLSMFSSGPDSFNFSQSWGWKSSSLILEEGLVGENDKDAKLRFMVVLGNV